MTPNQMTKEELPVIKTPQERDTPDLLQLVCELSGRLAMYGTKELHDAFWEARNELESRYSSSQAGATHVSFEQAANDEAKRRYPEEINVEKSTARNQRKNQRIFVEGAKWAGQATPVDGWIDVSVRPPEFVFKVNDIKTNSNFVLGTWDKTVHSGYFERYDRDFIDQKKGDVVFIFELDGMSRPATHWQPLPQPPVNKTP